MIPLPRRKAHTQNCADRRCDARDYWTGIGVPAVLRHAGEHRPLILHCSKSRLEAERFTSPDRHPASSANRRECAICRIPPSARALQG